MLGKLPTNFVSDDPNSWWNLVKDLAFVYTIFRFFWNHRMEIKKNWKRIEDGLGFSIVGGAGAYGASYLLYAIAQMIQNIQLGKLGEISNQPVDYQAPLVILMIGIVLFVICSVSIFTYNAGIQIIKIIRNPKYCGV